MNLKFYNTLTRSFQDFSPLHNDVVNMYSCGPTVYNVVHIGNLRSFLCADLIQRVLRFIGGYNVHWVMNITDIDDKLIRDSAFGSKMWLKEMGLQNEDPKSNLNAYAKFYEQSFFHDIQAIGIDLKHFYKLPRATEYIAEMQKLIADIHRNGFAYVSDGSVYFDVAAYEKSHQYGRLFQIDRENFRQGVRIDADEYDRESVGDFALWKAVKKGEPNWDFLINGQNLPGRPGWHVECSAMSRELLGLPLDVHTGGVDLRFPHHEDELAQCCAGYDVREQSSFWLHNEHLEVDGKKMSKSLNNYYTIGDLIKLGYDALDFRFALCQSHYRSKVNFTIDGLKAASASRKRIQEFIWEVLENVNSSDLQIQNWKSDGQVKQFKYLQTVADALADDVHTPRALAELNMFINSTDVSALPALSAVTLVEELQTVNNVFGVWTFAPRTAIEVPSHIRDLAEARWHARAAKNWAESDRLRQELFGLGWSVLDGKDSYELQPAND